MGRALETDVAVVGAGIAGCSVAIALRKQGLGVTLVEKSSGQPNRFCGEFVSGEALSFLDRLDVREQVEQLGPNRIRRLGLYPANGSPYTLKLANQGFGISRRQLDAALLAHASRLGAQLLEGTEVEQIDGGPHSGYQVLTKQAEGREGPLIAARAVVGAQGKRSAIDRQLGRVFVNRGSAFVGVKCHYWGAARGGEVELYLFPGGYCGVVGIEQGKTNLCLLATQRALETSGGRPSLLIRAAQRANPHLAEWLQRAEPVPGSLMAISQIPFFRKEQVVKGVFMVGDSAGLPAPFLGLGVANGIYSAIACSEMVGAWLRGSSSFLAARRRYEAWWRHSFARTQKWGYLASRVLCRPAASQLAVKILHRFPGVGESVYRRSRVEAAWEMRGPA